MTVRRQGRGAWTTRRPDVAPQGGTSRRGVAVHWPGVDGLDLSGHGDCLQLMDTLERNALREGYGALPYNQAACVHGYLIEGRGAPYRSGANGSTDSNVYFGSVVALIDTSARAPLPRPLLEALRASLTVQAPRGRLLAHRDVRPSPTQCPGPALTAWLKAGAPLPAAPGRGGSGRVHVVRHGDTLWGLAELYYSDGAKWERIADANDVRPEDLHIGQRLRVP